MGTDESSLGGRVGPRVASVIADALVYTKQRLGPHQNNLAQTVLADFTNHVSDEIRGVMRPIWKEFAENADTPPELKPLFNSLANERGQAWAWIGGNITGGVIGAALGDLFSNFLNPVIRPIIGLAPAGILTADTVATAAARNIGHGIDDPVFRTEAAMNGINGDRFDTLVELAKRLPAPQEVMEMLNRGTVTHQVARTLMERMGFERGWADALLTLAHAEMTLPDISAMWNRAIVSDDEAVELGKRVGYNETQIRRALELGGEPLPPEMLSEAFRRGFIGEERYGRGITQGPLRTEWFDVLARLQFHRMSPVDAADAVNQGHMAPDVGKRIAHEHGLDPNDFGVLLETAGAPPGLDFATEALNRGFIDEAQFNAMFLESRIKNRYGPLLLRMRTRLIPQETVRLAYREGVYSREKALETLLSHGFTPDDAASLLAIEESRQDGTTKELTRAQIVQMYEEQILDADITRQLLTGIGYSEANVELMIALADVKRAQKFINAAITRVRSAYLTGKIDANEVSIQLDALAVPSSQREELLTIWGIDRSTVTKTLTAAQIRQAFARDFITRESALERLVSQGYDDIDADLYLKLTA